MYGSYYQAMVDKPLTWLFVATLRSFEHVSFDRTLDKEQGIFEFFVPQQQEGLFLAIMAVLEKRSLVNGLTKLPNRLSQN